MADFYGYKRKPIETPFYVIKTDRGFLKWDTSCSRYTTTEVEDSYRWKKFDGKWKKIPCRNVEWAGLVRKKRYSTITRYYLKVLKNSKKYPNPQIVLMKGNPNLYFNQNDESIIEVVPAIDNVDYNIWDW